MPDARLLDLERTAGPTDVLERTFTVDGVPGVLWSPVLDTGPAPLVLMGHPRGLDKRSPWVMARAATFVRTFGFHAAAIDAPGHGERPRSDADAARVDRMTAARAAGLPLGPIGAEFDASIAERAVPEWQRALDALLDLPAIAADRPVGYAGMTLGTEIGLRLAADDRRIGAAGFGAAFASDGLVAVARRVRVPVQFLLPWDDPEIDRESGLALFDALGSDVKSLHVFPGPHQTVPRSEADDAAWFIARVLLDPRG